ncbi:MAG: endonuclease/exonuclease/phosphatase family protein [Colwellia sp.]
MTLLLKAKIILLASLFASSNLFANTATEIVTETMTESVTKAITVMSLNIYGWKTMPEHSNDYAQLVNSKNVDILGIQEGVEDWQLKSKLPTNYERSKTLKKSLGQCWQHKFQIFINHCQGNQFIESGRFDLSDGPNATRTGEFAVIEKSNQRYLLVNIHWDHESVVTRKANAEETAAQLNKIAQYPKILLGDFNSKCAGKEASIAQEKAKMTLLKNSGIDCLFVKGLSGKAKTIVAYPSDHPSIVATLLKKKE